METMFTMYGPVEWLEPDEYFKENSGWRYVGTVYDINEETYDIVEKDMEYRYTKV